MTLTFSWLSFLLRLGYDVGPRSVEIMDGSDEGIFIWYTVNFLHGKNAKHLLGRYKYLSISIYPA